MKKISKIIFIILSIILIKLVTTFTINEVIIRNYNNNIYNSFLIKFLYLLNFDQSYIAYYNEGNILYKTEEYDIAIEKYKKALEKNPPQNLVCDIRINLSLSMIKQIDSYDYTITYNQLEEAKNNLYNNNCASPIDDNGYSQNAEILEEEIKNLQEEISNPSNTNPPNNKKEEENYSNIEKKLKEINKEANANRQIDMSFYENMWNGSYLEKKW